MTILKLKSSNKNHKNLIIKRDEINIKNRISYLQQKLVQLSFYNKMKSHTVERSDLYKKLILSLKLAKRLLIENKKIQSNAFFYDD